MGIIDKQGILERIPTMKFVAIELGCGSQKKIPHAIGIDRTDYDSADIVCDLEEGLSFLPDNSIDVIYSFHFLEHMPDLGFFLSEIFRVLKPGGKNIGTVPHFSNPYYSSDYTHKTPFGLYTFCYFAQVTPYHRKVLKYLDGINFKITKQKIIFYSPFKFINLFRKIYGLVFNSFIFMQEYYEGSVSSILPAYEISFELQKDQIEIIQNSEGRMQNSGG
jgi:SAM-dependent methyltransferase